MVVAFLVAGAAWFLSPGQRRMRSGGGVNFVPRLKVEPRCLELGRLDPSKPGGTRGEIRISNLGAAPLEIRGFEASCGCTLVDLRLGAVAPGRTNVATVSVSPRNETGAHSSIVRLITNDPLAPGLEVGVRWTEQEAMWASPRAVDLGDLRAGAKGQAVVTLDVDESIDPRGLRVSPSMPCFSYRWGKPPEVPQVGAPPRHKVDLRLAVDTEKAQGAQSLELLIEGTAGGPSVRLPLRWRIIPAIEVVPAAIYKSGVGRNSRVENQVSLTADSDGTLELISVQVNGKRLPFTPKVFREGSRSRLLARFTLVTGGSPGVERRAVKMLVRDHRDIELSLPIVYVVE